MHDPNIQQTLDGIVNKSGLFFLEVCKLPCDELMLNYFQENENSSAYWMLQTNSVSLLSNRISYMQ